MRIKILSVLNFVVVIILIAWNGYANTGQFNGMSVGELSKQYNSLFTPAPYAFSIWGIIFLTLILFCANSIYNAFNASKSVDRYKFQEESLSVLLIVNLLCGLWVYVWIEEMIALSVIVMFLLLCCLIYCLITTCVGTTARNLPKRDLFFSCLPISMYTGWISIAMIANIAAYLNSAYNYSFMTQEIALAVMLFIAFGLNLWLLFRYKLVVFSLVGVWALAAIASRHWWSTSADVQFQYLGVQAAALATILLVGVCMTFVGMSYRS